LEPSCLAVFRDEMPDLLPYDQDARRLEHQTFKLAEFLEKKAPHFQPLQMRRAAIYHGYCHQKAVFGTGQEQELLRKTGLNVTAPNDGCCGMAGSFGSEPAKCAVSMKVGELGNLAEGAGGPERQLNHRGWLPLQNTNRTGYGPARIAFGSGFENGFGRWGAGGEPYPERRWLKLERNDGSLREAVTVAIGLALGALLYWALRREEGGF
jgi:hypothetical protein